MLVILFLGNSITEGYGLAPRLAFPDRIATRLADAGRPIACINAGRAGDTSAAALRRLPGYLPSASQNSNAADTRQISHLVLELGINDVMQGFSNAEIARNIHEIVRLTREHNPHAQIYVFRIPNLPANPALWNAEYARAMAPDDCLPALEQSARDLQLTLLPFMLSGILFEAELNQPDGIHPNPAGQDRLVENVWNALRGYLVPDEATPENTRS